MNSSDCSGACAAGYFCPAQATNATARPCGHTSLYCPAGSAQPRRATDGEYTIGLTSETRNSTAPCNSGSYCVNGTSTLCMAGQFGCADRLSTPDCNGPCSAGYYCPAGSTSNQRFPCGGANSSAMNAAAYFCPVGSAAPMGVSRGYYSVGARGDGSAHLQVSEAMCSVGTYCVNGTRVRGATDRPPPPPPLLPFLAALAPFP